MGDAAQKIQQEVEAERKAGAIIFLPSAIVPESFYRPVVEKIWLTDGDVYTDKGKFRIKYEGLLKLSNSAGIEWSPVDSGRTDNGSDKLYVSFRAVGLIRKADGKLYPTAANYDLDLELEKEKLEDQYSRKADDQRKKGRERESYINFCVKRDWFHKRTHKATLAESGAKARVIRSILGLQSQYSNKQDILGRAFVIVRFVLDHQNPDIKQAMLSAAKENMSAIYGGNLPQALPTFESAASDADVIDIPHEPDEPPPYQEPGPDIPFDGGPDSRAVDFENCDVRTQCRTLEDLCRQKNYNLDDYLKRAQKMLNQFTAAKRLEFFNYLNTL